MSVGSCVPAALLVAARGAVCAPTADALDQARRRLAFERWQAFRVASGAQCGRQPWRWIGSPGHRCNRLEEKRRAQPGAPWGNLPQNR
jgi:hypothetical protein